MQEKKDDRMKIAPLFKIAVLLILVFLLAGVTVSGQGTPGDSAQVLPKEEIPKVDTAKHAPPPKPKIVPVYYSFDDSVAAYFLPPRLNLADDLTRSFQHDPGDFFRFSPSFLTLEEQLTPYRKTISPFDLPGNRLNYILDSRALHPLEHLPEPDNKVDLDDIPASPVQNIYNINGPLGLVFGADNTASSLIMQSRMPDGPVPISKVVVDKGGSGYANTKALLAGRSAGSQSLRAALEYRKALTDNQYFSDDGSHQWGELIHPVGQRLRVDLNGRMYGRQGIYSVRPDVSAIFNPDRYRSDRDYNAALNYRLKQSNKLQVSLRHQTSQSRLSTGLSARYHAVLA